MKRTLYAYSSPDEIFMYRSQTHKNFILEHSSCQSKFSGISKINITCPFNSDDHA